DDRMEAALVEARAGHASRARRIADGVLRTTAVSAALAGRVGALETALREGGYLKEALQVRRTYAEGLQGDERAWAIAALAEEAERAGRAGLAGAGGPEAGLRVPRPARGARAPPPPGDHLGGAQRLLAQMRGGAGGGGEPARLEPVLALLTRAVAGHAGADAA